MGRFMISTRAALALASIPAVLSLTTPAFAQTASAPAASAAQQPAASAPAAATPEAKKEDVASMDAILGALYGVISGPAGQARDWDRFRSLFTPGARLIPTGRTQEGQPRITVIDPDGYIARSSNALSQGFFEKEISREVQQFGAVTHVFSTYESRHKADDAQPFARGINSIQLYNDGTRWWIVTVYWQSERPDTPLPAKYLPKK